jgi:hypothetical protein
MVTLVDHAAAASVRHDVDHPELHPVAIFSQIARHTAASCLNNCIHQYGDWIEPPKWWAPQGQ